MGTLNKIAYRILEKKTREKKREVKLFDFGQAKKIGVLWHITDMEAFLYVSEYFQGKQMIFRNLCFTGKSAETVANSFNQKETNWLGFPKSQQANLFMETDFDLLMNISVSSEFTLQVITALSPAKFKIGWAPEPYNFFDMTIDVSKNADSLYLAKQEIYYLEQFNQNAKK